MLLRAEKMQHTRKELTNKRETSEEQTRDGEQEREKYMYNGSGKKRRD